MRRTVLAPKVLAIVLLFFAHSAASLAQTGARGLGVKQTPPAAARYYALVVGNDDYQSLPKLKTAAADAREVERVLREVYGFQTKLLLNATRSQIVAALYAYRRELSADANLLIYYAGHGYSDKETEKTYWLPVDATGDDNSNWIIADDITSDIKAIPARHVLVVADSCYSGTLSRGLNVTPPPSAEREQFIQKMSAGRSRTLMASGGDEPVADGGGSGHSVFAAALLRGLQQMEKTQFTAGELFSGYVVESVAGRAEQTPVYDPLRNSGHEAGDFVFVRIRTPDGKTVEVTVEAKTTKVDPEAIELSYWETIKDSKNPEDFKAYLEQYPNGRFASLARIRAGGASGAPIAVSLTGAWWPADGPPIRFVQQGNRVTGTYRGGRGHESMTGTISGTFDGKTFDGTFENHEGSVSGRGTVTLTLNGDRLEGVWAATSTPGVSGEWILRRKADETTNPPASASSSTGEVEEKPRTPENMRPPSGSAVTVTRNGASVSGRWTGSWTNSKGDSGSTSINISEQGAGTLTGDEGGWVIVNGRRDGNVLTWEYRNQNDGCVDYAVRFEISADGRTANGTYTANDRCQKQTYTGKYLNYHR